MDLSIILTSHNEGLLIHKALFSVSEAIKALPTDTTLEVIIHLDNCDDDTQKYINRFRQILFFPDNTRVRILKNTFGDAGLSRNFAVQEAKGEYIVLMDGDDLISQNYLSSILEILKSTNDEIIVHPEISVAFNNAVGDSGFEIWKMHTALSREDNAIILLGKNRWVSSLGAKRETLLRNKYPVTGNGFGHEDYTFNIVTAGNNIKHVVAKNTIYFYRQKQVSLLRINNAKFYTQPYSELFNIFAWKKFDAKLFEPSFTARPPKPSLRKKMLQSYVAIRNNKVANTVIRPFADLAKKISGKTLTEHKTNHAQFCSEEALRYWKNAAKIETQLYPSKYKLNRTFFYNSDTTKEDGRVYYEICQNITHYPDYVFVVPWLMPGGADKVLLNYLTAIKKIHPSWKLTVITVVPSLNEWASKLPEGVDWIDYGGVATCLPSYDFFEVFTRLMIQLKVKKLHIINAQFGYEWLNQRSEYAKHHLEVYISLFCHDIIPNTGGEGIIDYADPNAVSIYPLVKKIYTDNAAVVNKLIHRDGFEKEKIKVIYQPNTDEIVSYAKNNDKKLRILWASRITAQKNPELLLRIANKLNPEEVQIDAYGYKDADYAGFEFPTDSQTIHYRGEFNGLRSIDLSKYDCLLYTSRIDGLPNILLESTAAGLPIVASAVGGVVDFLRHRQTGILVQDSDNEDAYVSEINKIYHNKDALKPLVNEAQKLLRKQHSWKTFLKSLKSEI